MTIQNIKMPKRTDKGIKVIMQRGHKLIRDIKVECHGQTKETLIIVVEARKLWTFYSEKTIKIKFKCTGVAMP